MGVSDVGRGELSWKRYPDERYRDFCMLADSSEDEMVFFGGRDYVPLFCELTSRAKAKRKVFHRAVEAPIAPGCILVKFETTTRTNWHYECSSWFLQQST